MWWDLEPKYPKVIYSKKTKRSKLLKTKISKERSDLAPKSAKVISSKERWDLEYFLKKLNSKPKQHENHHTSMSIEIVTINNQNLEEQNQQVTSNKKSKQFTL